MYHFLPLKGSQMRKTKEKSSSAGKDKAVRWLTSVPEDSTPLGVATDAAREIEYVVFTMSHHGHVDNLFESLQTILSAMHTSAGAKYPKVISRMEAPTEEDVAKAYDNLSYVGTVLK